MISAFNPRHGRNTGNSSMPSLEIEKTIEDRTRMEALINIAFKREVIRKVKDVILPLNDIGSGPPFYCVHSLGGAATEFRHMARMLGPRQKFYGIQAPTDKRNAEFGASIREMSRYYVDELMNFSRKTASCWEATRSVQPSHWKWRGN